LEREKKKRKCPCLSSLSLQAGGKGRPKETGVGVERKIGLKKGEKKNVHTSSAFSTRKKGRKRGKNPPLHFGGEGTKGEGKKRVPKRRLLKRGKPTSKGSEKGEKKKGPLFILAWKGEGGNSLSSEISK